MKTRLSPLTEADLARERAIDTLRFHVHLAATARARRKALQDLQNTIAARSPAAAAWMNRRVAA